MTTKEEDFVEKLLITSNHERYCLSQTRARYTISMPMRFPQTSRTAKAAI